MNETTPLLWLLNRSTGLSLTLALSASVALGVLTLRGHAGGDGGARLPRFVTRSLHRNVAIGALALLVAHVVTAVADTYVDIRWWQAVVPWGGTYEPLWLGLGALALDLLVAVAVTTALRGRLGYRGWRLVHLSSWLAWVAAVAHGVMIGTDLGAPPRWVSWAAAPTLAGIALVASSLAYRVLARPRRSTTAPRPLDALAGGR
ncbi:ferric reductase-like transmembrane domain-containing protein [Nocardioides daeguensis]|uniref:Ferric oxidoreductase domain-containing protein n=1 Tax=Nocardioides daeguensis TaxID=908359 RepID=A0ABP6W5T5_9ACTN|nr:ferric reductase-like transmembrane domain-containing protein [Nocardioides daeguensis]MBV6727664.1 ferric reductase-like transmembrane domain-containing protein [Nocardioides daeguensis]MCR1775136.1 ferric reductase-like transmembrane domain-containing protein [Nocardioides daeguensis]